MVLDEVARFRAQNERMTHLVDGLSDEQRHWKPAPDQWSVAEVADHLRRTAEPYLSRLSAARGDRDSSEPTPPHKPGLIGGFLVRAVQPGTRAVPAPNTFQPRSDVATESVFDEVRSVHAKLEEEMLRWEGLDTNRPKFASPVTSLIRLKPGDAIALLVGHTERHVNQMARVVASGDFPA